MEVEELKRKIERGELSEEEGAALLRELNTVVKKLTASLKTFNDKVSEKAKIS